MKSKVLSLLKERYPDYISGEEISNVLGISRTAVWKHVKGLRETGYDIESHSKVGYRLIKTPDIPYEYELRSLLKTNLIGKELVFRESVDSTNKLAKELANSGAPEGTVVIADRQTSGRGRMGREWYSPKGQGLWFSIVLRPPLTPLNAYKLTIVSSVALATAINAVTGLNSGIKWPNDIIISGHKVCGILTEMSAELDKINYVIVGIGVNVNLDTDSLPDSLTGIAGSLSELQGSKISRIKLLAAILNNVEIFYKQLLEGNFEDILILWKQMSVTIGRMVKVTSFKTVLDGKAVDIDDDGNLVLEKRDGTIVKIMSGDVCI